MEFPADQVLNLVNEMLPDLAAAAVTGLVVAPATAWVVEGVRKSEIRKRRRPLLQEIKRESLDLEQCATNAFFLVEILKTEGIELRVYDRDKVSELLRSHPQEARRLVYLSERIIAPVSRLSDKIDKVLDVVAPHLEMEQVASIVRWSAEVRDIAELLSRPRQGLNELWHEIDVKEVAAEKWKLTADTLADMIDDIEIAISSYRQLGVPPTRPHKVKGELKDLPTGEPSLRDTFSKHLEEFLPKEFGKDVPSIVKKLVGKGFGDKVSAIHELYWYGSLSVTREHHFSARSVQNLQMSRR